MLLDQTCTYVHVHVQYWSETRYDANAFISGDERVYRTRLSPALNAFSLACKRVVQTRLLNAFTVCSTRPLFSHAPLVSYDRDASEFSATERSTSVRRLTIQRTVCVQSYVCLKLFAYACASTLSRYAVELVARAQKKGRYQGPMVHATERVQQTCLHVKVNAFTAGSKHVYTREQTRLSNAFISGDQRVCVVPCL